MQNSGKKMLVPTRPALWSEGRQVQRGPQKRGKLSVRQKNQRMQEGVRPSPEHLLGDFLRSC